VVAGPDETLDELLRGRVRIWQPRRGPRVSLDTLLLAAFAAPRARRAVADLGCGVGAVGLALLAADPRVTVAAVELQPALADLARRNAVLNGVAARMEVVTGDLRAPLLPAETFAVVVCNPPFHAPSRPAAAPARALARQELACTIGDVASAARRLLRPRGELVVVYPAARLGELVTRLVAADLAPRTLRFVHSVAGEPAVRALCAAARSYRGGVEVLPPLVVHGDDRRAYTDEAAQILGEEPRSASAGVTPR
jgi:tRNA1Val (adenine37-N6)-methyltransferase